MQKTKSEMEHWYIQNLYVRNIANVDNWLNRKENSKHMEKSYHSSKKFLQIRSKGSFNKTQSKVHK